MTEDAEIKGVIPSYYGFLITGITQIREYWAKKLYIEALNYALELSTFLPTKIKKELADKKALIVKKLANNIPAKSSTIYSTYRSVDREAYKVALVELEPFMDEMIKLLDANHLLTEGHGVPTRARSMKEFQMTVDHAKYEAEK